MKYSNPSKSICPYPKCKLNCVSAHKHRSKYASLDIKNKNTKSIKKRSVKVNYTRLEAMGIFL